MNDRISKILIDNNLSVKLPEVLAADFPDSMHVAALQLAKATDTQLWELAQRQHFAIMRYAAQTKIKIFITVLAF